MNRIIKYTYHMNHIVKSYVSLYTWTYALFIYLLLLLLLLLFGLKFVLLFESYMLDMFLTQ